MRSFGLFLVSFFILAGLVSFAAVDSFEARYPRPLGPDLGDSSTRQRYRDELDEILPEVVLLGDSVLKDGIDEALFSSLTGKTTQKIAIPGSASALWYIILKNSIAPSDHQSSYLIFFFRDTMLTSPAYRVTGDYFTIIDEFAGEDDQLLIERAYINQMSIVEQAAEQYFPLYGERLNLRHIIDYRLKNTLPVILLGCGEYCMEEALQDVFGEDMLDPLEVNQVVRGVEDSLYRWRDFRFEQRVEESFLPEILRIASEEGIQLIFVRTKNWRYPSPADEPPGLRSYLEDLARYLEENDAVFLDTAYQGQLNRRLFRDDFHMNPEGKAVFTELLADVFIDLLTDRFKK